MGDMFNPTLILWKTWVSSGSIPFLILNYHILNYVSNVDIIG